MPDQTYKVLLIDDSPEDRIIFRRYLRYHASITYQFYEASSGKEGLQIYHNAAPDCILLDNALPDMNGIMFLQLLHQAAPEYTTAIIILTGSGNEGTAVSAMKQGVHDYLIKDQVTPEVLQQAVISAMNKRELVEQINRQNESFRILAENSPDIIMRIDRNLRYIYINPAIQQMTGLAPEDFIGKTSHEVSLPENVTQIWSQTLQEVITSKQSQTIEYPFETNITSGYCQTLFVPEFDALQNVLSVLSFTRNVTHYREQLQEKDEFISLVSHELRTPLTATRGYIQLALRILRKIPKIESTPSSEEIASLLQRALHRLGVQNRLIDDLLDVARIQKNKLGLHSTPCDLLEVVQEVVEDQRASLVHRDIELDLSAVPATLPMYIDRNRISQVINNYVMNALKYSDKTHPVIVGVDQEATQIKVWVKDKGAGLNEQDQKRVWERFYQVNASTRSTGLGMGLYICQVLIALHGGTVGVESSVGEGSVFWFRLPILEDAMLAQQEDELDEGTDVTVRGYNNAGSLYGNV